MLISLKFDKRKEFVTNYKIFADKNEKKKLDQFKIFVGWGKNVSKKSEILKENFVIFYLKKKEKKWISKWKFFPLY